MFSRGIEDTFVKMKERNILLFDGVCNLCNGMVQFIIKRDPDGRFKFSALQSDSARKLLSDFGLSQSDFDSFVFIQNNTYYIKSTAVLRVAKAIGGVWKLFYAFIIIPRPVRDFIYNLIAKSRYRLFGKRDECMMPAPGLKERFI